MTTSADEIALLAGVAVQPEEDTPRLAYADWLDEHGVTTEQRERALYIRQSIDIDRGANPSLYDGTARQVLNALLIKCQDDWRRGPRCVRKRRSSEACPGCGNTGDLGGLRFKDAGETATGWMWRHHVDFDRGFPCRVYCQLAEVLTDRCDVCVHTPFNANLSCTGCGRLRAGEWRVTEWARRVVRWHPVTEFRACDREPYWDGGAHCFYAAGRRRPSPLVPEGAELPSVVLDRIPDSSDRSIRKVRFREASAARFALARTLAQIARTGVEEPAA